MLRSRVTLLCSFLFSSAINLSISWTYILTTSLHPCLTFYHCKHCLHGPLVQHLLFFSLSLFFFPFHRRKLFDLFFFLVLHLLKKKKTACCLYRFVFKDTDLTRVNVTLTSQCDTECYWSWLLLQARPFFLAALSGSSSPYLRIQALERFFYCFLFIPLLDDFDFWLPNSDFWLPSLRNFVNPVYWMRTLVSWCHTTPIIYYITSTRFD